MHLPNARNAYTYKYNTMEQYELAASLEYRIVVMVTSDNNAELKELTYLTS